MAAYARLWNKKIMVINNDNIYILIFIIFYKILYFILYII
jgi:hypothetical protein